MFLVSVFYLQLSVYFPLLPALSLIDSLLYARYTMHTLLKAPLIMLICDVYKIHVQPVASGEVAGNRTNAWFGKWAKYFLEHWRSWDNLLRYAVRVQMTRKLVLRNDYLCCIIDGHVARLTDGFLDWNNIVF